MAAIPAASATAVSPEAGDGNSADALCDWLEQFARSFGFQGGRYAHLGHRVHALAYGEQPPVRFLSTLGQEADPWRPGDPAALKIAVSFTPFPWTTQDDTALPDGQRGWLSIERRRGVQTGVAIPVQDYLAGPAYLSLFGREGDVAPLKADAGELLVRAAQFHCRAKEVLASDKQAAAPLTERELNCLRHAAFGASIPETATSIGISRRSVELYYKNATRKLGALNKIHAVALALSAGLIQI